jgi:hypothetical protein
LATNPVKISAGFLEREGYLVDFLDALVPHSHCLVDGRDDAVTVTVSKHPVRPGVIRGSAAEKPSPICGWGPY